MTRPLASSLTNAVRTEEEKLEPLLPTTTDPRIRLLNRLNARKRKELQERKALQDGGGGGGGGELGAAATEQRSVDELLSFIEQGDKGKAKPKNGKKRGGKGTKAKPPLPPDAAPSSPSALSARNPLPEDGFDDDDGAAAGGEQLSAAELQQLDAEVEEFARRLGLTAAQQQPPIPPDDARVLADGVAGLVVGLLGALGLGGLLALQTKPRNGVEQQQQPQPSPGWAHDDAVAVRVPGGTVRVRVVSSFEADG